METICERLRGERLRLKMSQEQLAQAGGVARSAQGNYERGERSPDTQYLAAVSLVGIDVTYVITGIRADNTDSIFDARSFAVCEKFQKLEEFDRQCIERFLSLLNMDH